VFIALPTISIAQWSYLPTIPGPIDLEELARPTYKIAATQPVVSEEEAVIKTYENLLPSVVSILITEKVSNDLGYKKLGVALAFSSHRMAILLPTSMWSWKKTLTIQLLPILTKNMLGRCWRAIRYLISPS
ncbi:MAG: hypothetical protein UV57_C0045G0001, partial [Parcubacteria group bacterium GW2011_GWD2_43_10]